jgi:hypothetical protein
MVTAFRVDAVRSMSIEGLNRLSGEVTVTTKGGKVMHGKLDPGPSRTSATTCACDPRPTTRNCS